MLALDADVELTRYDEGGDSQGKLKLSTGFYLLVLGCFLFYFSGPMSRHMKLTVLSIRWQRITSTQWSIELTPPL